VYASPYHRHPNLISAGGPMEQPIVQRPSHDNLRSVTVQDALGIDRDVPDEGVEALKELVGKHLRTQLKMYVSMYLCMYVCMYVCMAYLNIFIYTYSRHVSMLTKSHLCRQDLQCMYVCMYVCLNCMYYVCVFVYACMCMYVFILFHL
jgi:hypothetical protein